MNNRLSQPSEDPHPSSASHLQKLSSPQVDLSLDQSRPRIIQHNITTKDGTIIETRSFSIGQKIGQGAFAECFECFDLETREDLAVKVVSKVKLAKDRAKQKMLSEIKIHRSLEHKHVVKFHRVFEDATNIYIVLELCKNQSLKELLRRRKTMNEVEVQCLMQQIICGLQYLHSKKVIHRDLKLGNLFLNSEMEPKIGDFGLAAMLESDGEKRRTVCGTPNYIAPEVLDEKLGHSFEVDIWSLGVIMFALLTGKTPFEDKDARTTYKRIRRNDYKFPENISLSHSAKDLIEKILIADPSRRLTLDEILQHPFLNHGGKIPKMLPISSLVCAPLPHFLNRYAPHQTSDLETISRNKLRETTAFGPGIAKYIEEAKPVSLPSRDMNPKASTVEVKRLNFDFSKDENSDLLHTPIKNKFNNSGNPNNQAMIASGRNFRLDSGNQSIPKELIVQPMSSNSVAPSSSVIRDSIYVKKWYDYSEKYGMGYILSNGACGAVFNDGSKIILEPRGSRFEYVYEDEQRNVQTVEFMMENIPKGLEKKIMVFKKFQEYLLKKVAGETDIAYELDDESRQVGMVLVKKWTKTDNAILFRLSNRVVQVDFVDKTEIILNSAKKMVKYRNKKGERMEYPIESIAAGGNEAAKRLKYTKEMLNGILETNQKKPQQENTDFNHNGFVHGGKDLISRLDVTESS